MDRSDCVYLYVCDMCVQLCASVGFVGIVALYFNESTVFIAVGDISRPKKLIKYAKQINDFAAF